MTKEERAHDEIARALPGHERPAILCSFGKDSLVVLDLLSPFGVRTVLHAVGPDEQVDPEYAEMLSARYALEVFLLPKGRGHLFFLGQKPLFLSFLAVTDAVLLPFPTTLAPYQGEPSFDCIDEELRAVHGTPPVNAPDLIFTGQKRQDVERTSCEIVQRYLPPGEPGEAPRWGPLAACMPLAEWSDEDVWAYIEAHRLPVSPRMYDGRARRHATRPTCTRCHEPHGPAWVECPRLGHRITNLGHFTKDTGLARLAALGIVTAEQAAGLERGYAD